MEAENVLFYNKWQIKTKGEERHEKKSFCCSCNCIHFGCVVCKLWQPDAIEAIIIAEGDEKKRLTFPFFCDSI